MAESSSRRIRPKAEDSTAPMTPRDRLSAPCFWSAKHRKLAIWGWLGFVFSALAIGTPSGPRAGAHRGQRGRVGSSGQAIADAAPEYAQEMVLIQSASATAGQPQFRAVGGGRAARLEALPDTQNFENPLRPGQRGQISADSTRPCSATRSPARTATSWTASKPAVAAVDAPRKRTRASPSASSAKRAPTSRSTRSSADDFGKALITSLPVTLIILLIAFGALVAAGVPLLLALTAVIGDDRHDGPDQPLIGGVDSSINEVILLIGLAVGVDYSMFYLRREREEREAGRSEEHRWRPRRRPRAVR